MALARLNRAFRFGADCQYRALETAKEGLGDRSHDCVRHALTTIRTDDYEINAVPLHIIFESFHRIAWFKFDCRSKLL